MKALFKKDKDKEKDKKEKKDKAEKDKKEKKDKKDKKDKKEDSPQISGPKSFEKEPSFGDARATLRHHRSDSGRPARF